MKLLFKQRLFSWFDSYDIYDESGNVVYVVRGQLSWGHCLKIYDAQGQELGTVKERVLTLLPKFELFLGNDYVGCISKELTLFRPKFNIDCMGWHVTGDFFEWDYSVFDRQNELVAVVTKQLLNWTDTYVIELAQEQDALCALMLVLAIDAEKCSDK